MLWQTCEIDPMTITPHQYCSRFTAMALHQTNFTPSHPITRSLCSKKHKPSALNVICGQADDTIKVNFQQMSLKDNIKIGVSIAHRDSFWQKASALPVPIMPGLGIIIKFVHTEHAALVSGNKWSTTLTDANPHRITMCRRRALHHENSTALSVLTWAFIYSQNLKLWWDSHVLANFHWDKR